MTELSAIERLIVALDTNSPTKAIKIIEQTNRYVGTYKVGLELSTSILAGLVAPFEPYHKSLQLLSEARALFRLLDARYFYDPKAHDIGNTLEGFMKALRMMTPRFVSVHASVGVPALKKLVAERQNSQIFPCTILTSLTTQQVREIYGASPKEKVLQFSGFAQRAGAQGVICSAQEVPSLKRHPKLRKLQTMTPGIRPKRFALNDQARVLSPTKAIELGVDYLVVGRPVTDPPAWVGSSANAAELIREEIEIAIAKEG